VAPAADYRDAIQAHLRRLAERDLPPRTRELAQLHGIAISRVTVRAQKTRWGSCSARGTISLNWRLIHAPPFVQDYLIIHELMHRRQMNHSARYWKLVAEAFPRWREAEAWLKKTRLESLA
jgi:predicted metal-dependent hydrolase